MKYPKTIQISAIAILILLGLRTLSLTLISDLQDYSYYLHAATNLLSGHNPYYIYPTQVYPPASLLLFILLSLLPPVLSKLIWITVSLVSLFFAIKLFSFYALKTRSVYTISLIFLLSLQTFPVKYALAQGQINFLVFLGFALFYHFLSLRRHHLAGLVLSIIVILKVNPLLLLVYLLVTKNTKPLLSFFVSLITLNLFIDVLFPSHLNTSFIQTMINMNTHYSGYYYNTSLAAVFIRLFSQPIAQIANLTSSLLIWFFVLFTSRLARHNHLTFSLFITAILLTSPITWQHYLFWTIPAFLSLTAPKTIIIKETSRDRCPFWTRLCQAKKHGFYVKDSVKRLPSIILLIGLATFSFFLINLNLKLPQNISMQSPLYSHATLGLLLLFIILLYKQQRIGRHSQ